MKCIFFLLFCFLFVHFTLTTPVDEKNNNQPAKASFGQPFDEIVVQSSLTIRRKDSARQVKDPQKITSS